MRKIIKDKKGDVFQIPILLILLFISAIVGLLMLTLSLKIGAFWQESGMLNNTAIDTSTASQANQLIMDTGPAATDYMIFFLFLGSIVGICISAVRTNFSPTVIFLFILLMIITILAASGLVNIYQGFTSESTLESTASTLTLTNFIFSRYTPLIMTVIGGIVMMLMWGKSGGDIVT